jgi:hypothetical protein
MVGQSANFLDYVTKFRMLAEALVDPIDSRALKNYMTDTKRLKAKKPANMLFRLLGPGLVTGAADDDPSGIATYSQAGAQFGYGLLWTVFLTTPFMIAIQLVSARIGRVTGKGLAANVMDRVGWCWDLCSSWSRQTPSTSRPTSPRWEKLCRW